MQKLLFSQLNAEQKKEAVSQVYRFNRNFNFPIQSQMRGVFYKSEQAVMEEAEEGLLDAFFSFEVKEEQVNTYALISCDTVSPDYLKWSN